MQEVPSQLTHLAHSILDYRLFEVSGTPVTVATLVTAVLIFLLGLWLSRLVQRALGAAFRQWQLARPGTIAVFQRLAHYLVLFIATGVALDTLGVNLSTLFAAGAIFAVGIGFAMQNIAQNFVSGVILLVERAIKPGDVLEVEGRVVKVLEMGIRSTLVRTRDEEDLIVPNATLVQSTVKNFTLKDSLYRLRTVVGVVYSSDMKQVFVALQEVAEGFSWRHASTSPRVLMLGFGASSVDFEVSVWMDNPWDARVALSDLNEAIWWKLKEAQVVIAFPQVDVHLDAPVMRSLTALAQNPRVGPEGASR